MITVVPEGGLCNRLRVVASAQLLAQACGQALQVRWVCTPDFNARFSDLFDGASLPFSVLESSALSRPAKMLARRHEWQARLRAAVVLGPAQTEPGRFDIATQAALLRGREVFIRSHSRLGEQPGMFDLFVPAVAAALPIQTLRARAATSVGVHIRRTDNQRAAAVSTLDHFIALMRAEVRAQPATEFFVATDEPAVLAQLREVFGPAVWEYPKRAHARNDPTALVDAVVDLYTLAHCRKLIGSHWSSFTDTAAALAGVPLVIAGAAGQAMDIRPLALQAAPLLADGPVVCVSHGFQTNYERGFCNGLAAHGVALTLISSDRTDTQGLAPGIRTVNLRGSQEEDRPSWRKAANLLRYHASLMACAVARRRATWHVMGLLAPLVWCGLVEGLWLRLVCRRYVLTVHDLLPHDQHNERARRICRWAYRLPHRLVVHTERMKRQLVADFGLDAQKVVVMEHGIEPLPQPGTDPLPGLAVDAGRPMLLVFGIVVPRKGIDLLLLALRDLPLPWRLVIAGACPDDAYRQQLRAMLQDHPRRAEIEWRDGFVAEAEMERLFRAADLLVLPYRYIDQSGVLFQALRFGVPVLATRVGGFERYITPEVGELAVAGSAAALHTALLRWAARRHGFSPARIRDIGKAYEWPTTVIALARAYRQHP